MNFLLSDVIYTPLNSFNFWLCCKDDPKKVDHLLALDGAKERLHLFKANLLEEGSFDSAISGCDGVFHTASPIKLDSSNPQVNHPPKSIKCTNSFFL